MSSFLKDRKMSVCIKGHVSRPREVVSEVVSGVPQGSVLGPLLFLIYINSVASQLSSPYKIFADDLKIYACVQHLLSKSNPPSSTTDVQKDIDILQTTAASWGLHMNTKKCAVIRFSMSRRDIAPPTYLLNGQLIPAVDSHVDLGVAVDSDLKFHGHVRSVVHRAGGLAQSYLRSTVCRSPDFMLFLLTTHIRLIIEYCSCVWHTGYLEDLRLLEKIQRRWTKQIDGLDSLSYSDRLQSLKLYSVQGRLLRADLIQCWKMFNDKCCVSPDELFDPTPQNRTRGHCFKMFPSCSRTDVRKRTFAVRCIPLWNNLPASVVCAPDVTSFKRMLESYILDDLYAYV